MKERRKKRAKKLCCILTQDEHDQVGDGEREEVIVGSRVHRLDLNDYETNGEIAKQSANEDKRVGHRQWNQERQPDVFRAQHLQKEKYIGNVVFGIKVIAYPSIHSSLCACVESIIVVGLFFGGTKKLALLFLRTN